MFTGEKGMYTCRLISPQQTGIGGYEEEATHRQIKAYVHMTMHALGKGYTIETNHIIALYGKYLP